MAFGFQTRKVLGKWRQVGDSTHQAPKKTVPGTWSVLINASWSWELSWGWARLPPAPRVTRNPQDPSPVVRAMVKYKALGSVGQEREPCAGLLNKLKSNGAVWGRAHRKGTLDFPTDEGSPGRVNNIEPEVLGKIRLVLRLGARGGVGVSI